LRRLKAEPVVILGLVSSQGGNISHALILEGISFNFPAGFDGCFLGKYIFEPMPGSVYQRRVAGRKRACCQAGDQGADWNSGMIAGCLQGSLGPWGQGVLYDQAHSEVMPGPSGGAAADA